MEAVEEPPLQNASTEPAKNIEVTCEESAQGDISVQSESELCHKSNGVAEADTEPAPSNDESEIPSEQPTNAVIDESHPEISDVVQEPIIAEEIVEETTVTACEEGTKEELIEEEIVKCDGEVIQEEHEIHIQAVEIDGIVDTVHENVRFETEILIETNVDDQNTSYKIIYEDEEQLDHTNNMLNDIGQNIELSEVLRSSDITENVENNNCEVAQEVFNKEELLDILEGNDIEDPKKVASDTFAADCKKLETQLALQQLSRLKQTRKVRTPKKMDKKIVKIESPKDETPKKRSTRHKEVNSQTNSSSTSEIKVESARKKNSKQKEDVTQVSKEGTTEDVGKKRGNKQKEDVTQVSKEDTTEDVGKTRGNKQKEDVTQVSKEGTTEDVEKKRGNKQKDESSQSSGEGPSKDKEENAKKKKIKQKEDTEHNSEPVESSEHNIVNALVQDWDDEEPSDQPQRIIEESEQILGETEELVEKQEAAVNESQVSNTDISVAESVAEEVTPGQNKNDSESQPQRRLSRVIKKKVIFDPDNPDTFTKTKVTIKKENQTDKDQKEQPTPKKLKTDVTSRSQSKSPIQSKLQWKKPQPKNLKTNKRLTEIDRLLMDEGAVNMICQLTPEAPQGNKNMKSKAEFIKKIQSSTPEGKEMKFRERKKEMKAEEGDLKKISGGKHRLSLNNSVKSPSVSEDFEAHSADDSIIYRRHSSSSYSSPCMSPRRMSDVEGVTLNAGATPQQAASNAQLITAKEESGTPPSDVFMVDAESSSTPVINKNNLMSMKEKLNSKLSLALNKRKRESTKPEKPTKMKRVSRSSEKQASGEFKYLKLTMDQSLAEICIQSIGTHFNVEVMTELRTALEAVDSDSRVSVTLLTSDTGTLCSGLDLDSVLDPENGANHAIELAESVRLLLSTLERHSKLVCSVIEEQCHGLALALVALSDVSIASETATFQLTSKDMLQPGAAALTTQGLTHSLVNELVLLERTVGAGAAAGGGLVARTVWPASAHRTTHALAKDILTHTLDDGAGRAVWPERVQEQARNLARDLAAQPHQNIMLKKQLLRLKRGSSETFQSALQVEREHFAKFWSSAEGIELIRSSQQTAKE